MTMKLAWAPVDERENVPNTDGHREMNRTLLSIAQSWRYTESRVNPTADLLEWVERRNAETAVDIHKISLEECAPWFYDSAEGCIRNQNRSFFTVTGLQGEGFKQPVIIQNEIGYLGILCKEFDGVMHFLLQAKIEPGNVNCVQISPTIQATKSNFTRKHGGKQPPYLDYFLNAARYEIVADQIQSEQSSRFYKKRNRNIMIRVDEDVPVLPSFRWMTLGQIKTLMRYDNLVNMDTRTVLSCIPFSRLQLTDDEWEELSALFPDKPLFRSVFEGSPGNPLPTVYQYINNAKMFSEDHLQFVPLDKLENWEPRGGEFVCREPYPFKVVFCDIAIQGREVRRWTQPLFEATGVATFGLVCCEEDGVLKFLVRAAPEVGCFDVLELGPTVQQEAVAGRQKQDAVTRFFWDRLQTGEGVMFDHLLSEEGGRFYHEQNRNVLLRVGRNELPALPEGYFLLTYRTLNRLVEINNILNIQLRNLLSLLEG